MYGICGSHGCNVGKLDFHNCDIFGQERHGNDRFGSSKHSDMSAEESPCTIHHLLMFVEATFIKCVWPLICQL